MYSGNTSGRLSLFPIIAAIAALGEWDVDGDPMDDYAGFSTDQIREDTRQSSMRDILSIHGLSPEAWNEILRSRTSARWVHVHGQQYWVDSAQCPTCWREIEYSARHRECCDCRRIEA